MARRLAALLLGLFVLAGGVALADEASDRSWLVGWVEKTISTPDRQIRLGRIDGALSSDVRLESITIADRRGVWFAIRDVHLVWSRADLLKGRLTVASLDAGSIEMTRKPDPATGEAATDDASADFALPDLPVAASIGRISVPTVRLPAEVAGRPTVLSIAGRGRLDGGDLDVDLSATRIEPQGGSFSLTTTYAEKTRRIALALALHEPKGGLLSTILALPGEPPIGFAIRGDAPIDTFTAAIGLDADGKPLLAGRAETKLDGTDRTFAVDVDGSLEDLVGRGGALTGGGSELHLFARRSADGTIRLDRARLKTGAASFDAAGGYVPTDAGTAIALDRLAVAWKTASLELARPTTIRIADGTVTVPPSSLRLGLSDAKTFGTIDVAGSAGRDLALDVTARRLPLAIARVAAPDLGADGTVALDAHVAGPRKAPTVAWKLIGEELSTAAARAAHLPPAKVTARGDFAANATTLDATAALGPDATATAKGRVPLSGDGLALDVAARRVPLAFADGVAPGLGGRGAFALDAQVGGSLAAPTAAWKVTGAGLSIAGGRAARLPAADLTASGAFAADATTLDAAVTLGADAGLTAKGRLPFTGDGLALDLTARHVPLALADGASPGLGGRGTLSATATATGSLAAPQVDWKVAGETLSVAATRDAGLALLTLAANGRLDRTATTLTATLADRDRIKLSADGRVPLDGGDLAMKIRGSLSLALADATLRERGARATGRADLDVAVAGPLAAPKPTGTITLADGTFTDPETAMRLSGIGARLRMSGDRVTVEDLHATTGKNGSVAVRGGVGLGADLPADLTLTLRGANLAYGDVLRTEVGGELRLTGPIAREPMLSGRLDLGRT
ncbi:MAG: hypothetical protein GX458_15185, partial [Phyllobacteriaceae bacterium]|nr:hypothetical protein [Phyllobacteriaceae bacterium]